MRWLVTGGCGFLGTRLVRRLAAEGGHAMRVIDNLSVGTREALGGAAPFVERDAVKLDAGGPPAGDVELVVGDILDETLAATVSRGVDVIVHLAANTGVEPSVREPRRDCVTNVLGTLNYLEAARQCGIRRFVFASSGAPVGECEPPIHEDVVPRPVSPYGASKLAGEGYCSAYFRTFGVETVALRFGNVYGPGSGHKTSVVARFIQQALRGGPLEIYGDGMQSRDFVYVDDLVDAVCAAATTPGVGGEVFQIATSTETVVAELATRLGAVLSAAGLGPVEILRSAPRAGDVRRNFADTRKAKQQLGWEPHVDLGEGLRRTLEWFLEMKRSTQ